jgi:hypothetical protein
MPASRRARWRRAAGRAAAALGRIHYEQVYMWEAYLQASRASVPEDGPLTWILTLDGYRLSGSHLPEGRAAGTP